MSEDALAPQAITETVPTGGSLGSCEKFNGTEKEMQYQQDAQACIIWPPHDTANFSPAATQHSPGEKVRNCIVSSTI